MGLFQITKNNNLVKNSNGNNNSNNKSATIHDRKKSKGHSPRHSIQYKKTEFIENTFYQCIEFSIYFPDYFYLLLKYRPKISI